MDRNELRARGRELYADEMQYALAREDEVLTDTLKERATMRLAREVSEEEVYELCYGTIESVARQVERQFVVDLSNMQLSIGGAIRTSDRTLVPVDRARARDWIAFDALREASFQDHAAKRAREREAIRAILARLDAFGGDAATIEACPDLFFASEEGTG